MMRHVVLVSRGLVKSLLIGLLSVLPLHSFINGHLLAEGNGWVDGALPILELGSVSPMAPPTCSPSSFTYQSLTKPDGTYSPIPRELATQSCVVTNLLGTFGTGPGSISTLRPPFYTMIQPKTAYAYRTVVEPTISTGVVPVPNQKAFVMHRRDGNLYQGTSLRFVDNLAGTGSFQAVANQNIKEMVYRFTDLPEPLRDAGSNIIYKINYAFSQNGQWMIIEAEGLGALRINTQTRQMHLVDTIYYQYGQGFTPSVSLAISNDGNSAIRSDLDADTRVYDLSGCHSAPFNRNSSNNTTSGCRSRSVKQSIQQQFPGFRGMSDLRFHADGYSVTGRLARNKPAGGTEILHGTYSVAGYTPEQVDYLALGDSFSSGEGAHNYEPGTNEQFPGPRNKCHLSKDSYPYIVASVAGASNFHNVACSGARSLEYHISQERQEWIPDNPLGPWLPGYRAQFLYLEAAKPSAVTLTMIGNDIGFDNKIKRCVLVVDACFHFKEDRESIAREIYDKFDNLVALYEDIQKDSGGAKVYVIGYPQLTSTGNQCDLNFWLDYEERLFMRGLTSYLNAVIKAATQKSGVVYVDVENTLDGHEHCEQNVKAVNGLVGGNDILFDFVGPVGNESFHPNALGHQLMSQALLAQSENLTRPMPILPNGQEVDNTVTAPYVGSNVYNDLIGNAPSGGVYSRATYTALSGADVLFKAVPFVPEPLEQILKPTSVYSVVINSTPTQLGTLTTDANGQLTGQVVIPESVEPGFHTIHIYGQNIAGEEIDLYKTIYVAASETDYDGDGIPNDAEQCLAVEPANVDEDQDGIDDACDGYIDPDGSDPIVTGASNPAPNSNGWNNTDVTIDWTATDPEPSSGAPTDPPDTIANIEGEHIYTSEQSCDPAGNCATGSLTLKIDKSAPEVTPYITPSANADGWHNSDVTVGFSCSDSVSGIDTCADSITVSTEGYGEAITGTAVDMAGNTHDATATINLDKTNPEITYTATPLPNANGWNNGDVLIEFSCSDSLSGVKQCSEPVVLSAAGGNQTVIGTATDYAGNTSSVTTTDISIDLSSPSITYAQTPTPNASGWSNTDVTVTFSCLDDLSGVQACSEPITLTTEGQNQQATGSSIDYAGNESSITLGNINIDKTVPTITASVSTPSNGQGWNNGAVTITFECSDELSGVESCSEPIIVNTEGQNQEFTGTAVDKAGNQVTTTVTVSIDNTSPTIVAIQSPPANNNGWNNTDVTVSFVCSDELSGIQFCSQPIIVNTEGQNQSITGNVTDNAGNTNSVTANVSIDKTAPTTSNVQVNPAAVLFNGTISITANVFDALSGVEHAEYYIDTDPGLGNGTVMTINGGQATAQQSTSGLAFGQHTVYVRVRDNAGNWSSVASATFTRIGLF